MGTLKNTLTSIWKATSYSIKFSGEEHESNLVLDSVFAFALINLNRTITPDSFLTVFGLIFLVLLTMCAARSAFNLIKSLVKRGATNDQEE